MVGTALLLNALVLQMFTIPTISMEPTLGRGDRILVEKISYRIGSPEPGDVIVFEEHTPDSKGTSLIEVLIARLLGRSANGMYLCKRVVAVEGDVVTLTDGSVYVNYRRVADSDVAHEGGTAAPPIAVPEGHVYVLGDNREQSRDSRYFGAISEATIVGRAMFVVWPISEVSTL